jgi:hypothetical protein
MARRESSAASFWISASVYTPAFTAADMALVNAARSASVKLLLYFPS